MSTEIRPSNFFGGILTQSQLLTRRTVAVSLAITVVGAIALTAWTLNPLGAMLPNDDESNASATEARLHTVVVSTLEAAGPPHSTQTYTGIVTAKRESRLSSKAIARIEKVFVDLGDEVEQGTLLLELDNRQLRADLDVAKANLAAAKSRLEELIQGPRKQEVESARAQVADLDASLKLSKSNLDRKYELRKSRSISQQEFDEDLFQFQSMEARLRSAKENLSLLEEGTRREIKDAQAATVRSIEAQIARIEADLSDRQIVAPFDGQISSRGFDEGVVVSPGQELLRIVESAPYEVRVGVPPNLLPDQSQATSQQIFVNFHGRALVAELTRISPEIDPRTRTREIVLELGRESSIAVGIGASVSVTVQTPMSLEDDGGHWVPSKALTSGPRGLYSVLVAEPAKNANNGEHTLEPRLVELLRSKDDWYRIKSGPIGSQEQIVIEGIHKVVPGQTVLVVGRE